MAVTISNKYNNTGGTAAILAISNIVVNSGEQLFIGAMGADGTASGTTGKITNITYGGVGLTKVVEDTANTDDGLAVAWWQLQNPKVGTANGTVTFNGTPSHGVFATAYTIAGGDINVDASAHNGATSASSPTLGTVTTIKNNALVIDIFAASSGGETITVGGAPQIQDFNVGDGLDNFSPTGNSHYIKTPAGAAAFSWTPSNTTRGYSWAAVSIAPSAAAGNLVQSAGTAVLGLGSTSASWINSTTTGNLIVVGVNLTNAAAVGTVSSITDTQSNTYTRAIRGTISSLGDVINAEIWYSANITGGAGSVIVNHTVDNCAMYVREYKGGFSTLDVTNPANGSSTTPNTGTSSNTTKAVELVVVATGDDKGATQTWASAGVYGDMVGTATTLTGLSMEDNVTAATGAQTGTLTLGASANWEGLLASFLIPASGRSPSYRTLVGIGQ